MIHCRVRFDRPLRGVSQPASQEVPAPERTTADEPPAIAEVTRMAEATIARLQQQLGRLDEELRQQRHCLEQVSQEYVAALAKQLFHEDRELAESRLKQQVLEGLQSLPESRANVFVHPQCVDALREIAGDTIHVSAAPHIAPGDCLLEADGCGIAGRLQSQVDRVVAQWRGDFTGIGDRRGEATDRRTRDVPVEVDRRQGAEDRRGGDAG